MRNDENSFKDYPQTHRTTHSDGSYLLFQDPNVHDGIERIPLASDLLRSLAAFLSDRPKRKELQGLQNLFSVRVDLDND